MDSSLAGKSMNAEELAVTQEERRRQEEEQPNGVPENLMLIMCPDASASSRPRTPWR
jgi:hypothetical protein